jgi:hypothetical protein
MKENPYEPSKTHSEARSDSNKHPPVPGWLWAVLIMGVVLIGAALFFVFSVGLYDYPPRP